MTNIISPFRRDEIMPRRFDYFSFRSRLLHIAALSGPRCTAHRVIIYRHGLPLSASILITLTITR